MAQVNPGLRQRVRALAEAGWGEPVTVVFLGDVAAELDVPGRRQDGTDRPRRLTRPHGSAFACELGREDAGLRPRPPG